MTFDGMFRAIHGYDPFPWQSRAAKLLTEKDTSVSINVPTASGKTALIDAALYAAAHGGPRRIAFIIDRRVVVDEAYLRAKRIAEALSGKGMEDISSKLGPLQVVRLRGGVHGDDDWVLFPERTTIFVSTVDQIGSRLLHRGYGVSPRMSPMHAGFVGNDCLYIVDEAHLAVPFIETVQACRDYGAHIRLISMTATPVLKSVEAIELTNEDRSQKILKQRLEASKRARLINVKGSETDFVKAAVSQSKQQPKKGKVIGVIVNRVATARRIWTTLIKQRKRAELLTGRIRPYDRDCLMERLFPEIRAGRLRQEGVTLFIVATQTVEVGADIDFDTLITEAAPLDSLRQRFGRLDRFGELGASQGIILYRQSKKEKPEKKPDPDPIYGMAIHESWQWLNSTAIDGHVDFGITAMDRLMRDTPPPTTEPKHAPVLLPNHVKMLSQTGPESPLIDVSSWLHGAESASSDVSVVWRGDILPDDQTTSEAIRLRPPLSREALEIPVYAVRSWLQGKRLQDFSDLEGTPSPTTTDSISDKPVLRWRGPDDFQVVQSNEIRPGDTIVLPSIYGGCDEYGWAPGSQKPVKDIADFCSLERAGGHVVRLVSGLTGWLGPIETAIQEAVAEVRAAETDVDPETGVDQDRLKVAYASLRSLLKNVDHPLISSFQNKYTIEIHSMGVFLRGRVIDDVKGTLDGGVEVTLSRHLDGVAQKAAAIAIHHPEMTSIITAAEIHDQGKQEPRFQCMLHGNSFAAASKPPLAKSGLRKLSAMRAAYAQSGLPKGFRHELTSLVMSDGNSPLVSYLVGTHHGYGRPYFPVCADTQAIGAEWILLDSGWGESVSNLAMQYGHWGLAEMELLLRAADARQSIDEQQEQHND